MIERPLIKCAIITAMMAFLATSCTVPSSPKKIPKPPPKKEEIEPLGEISVTVEPKIDILFVIDNSGSMSSHQTNLSANIQSFTRGITENKLLDYHIGVTSTDFDDSGSWSQPKPPKVGMLMGTPKFIDKSVANGIAILADNLVIGSDGGGEESTLIPLMNAISEPLVSQENLGFFRDDEEAYLAIVFITDAVDQSDFEADDVYEFMLERKAQDKFVFYGAIIPTGITDCTRDPDPTGHPNPRSPIKMETLVAMTGGQYFNLCDPQFGDRLGEMGDDLADRIRVFVPLIREPLLETIRVTYGDQIIPNDPVTGWTYDPNRVGLHFSNKMKLSDQPEGTKPRVTFIPAKRPEEIN